MERYEFLVASKDEGTWKKGKAAVMSKAGALGFELLKAVLGAEVRRQLGYCNLRAPSASPALAVLSRRRLCQGRWGANPRVPSFRLASVFHR